MDNVYVPVMIEELPDGNLQGYSAVLNLHLRWEQGQLAWYDPATGNPILTYQDQHGRAGHRARGARQSRSTGPRTRGTKTAPEPVEHRCGHQPYAAGHYSNMRNPWPRCGPALNQSKGGMCICLRRGIVLGIRQECFGP